MERIPEVDGETALSAVQAALAEARRLSVLVSVAVVDAGGHLKVFYRMDGAEIAGPVLAVDKAYTAVANRMATAELGRLAQPGGSLYGIEANHGGRFVVFAGGLPVWWKNRVIAGVGVSGAEADQDAACAASAVRVIEAALHAAEEGDV
jgi:uncharacterized protein GlcG (DUF336 family)